MLCVSVCFSWTEVQNWCLLLAVLLCLEGTTVFEQAVIYGGRVQPQMRLVLCSNFALNLPILIISVMLLSKSRKVVVFVVLILVPCIFFLWATELNLQYLGCFLQSLSKDIHVTYVIEELLACSPNHFLLKWATVLVNRDKHNRNCWNSNIMKLLVFSDNTPDPEVRIRYVWIECSFQEWSQVVKCERACDMVSGADAYLLCSLMEVASIFLAFI